MQTDPDAIFIHAYWLSKENNRITLSLRGKLAIQAAAILFERSQTKPYLVLSGGPIWGPSYPTLAQVMADELRETYGIPKNRIIIRDTAFDTNDEIRIFLHLAKKYRWKQLLDLACKKHFWTIKFLYKKSSIKPGFVKIEQVLKKHGDILTRQQVKKFGMSVYEVNYALYQLAIRIVLLFDPEYKKLGKRAQQTRMKPHPYGLLPFLPIDIYKF